MVNIDRDNHSKLNLFHYLNHDNGHGCNLHRVLLKEKNAEMNAYKTIV